jgi:protein-tyrosine-phosphatase
VEWRIPDPTSAPAGERREAYRAARDEITRRLRALLAELDP